MNELSFTDLHVLAVNSNHYAKVLESAIRMLRNDRPVYIYRFDNGTVTISDHPLKSNTSLFG